MKEQRRDNRGRLLKTGESQRADGRYLYKYTDAFGEPQSVYSWKLTPTDTTPKGKRDKLSLRELEQQIRRDIEDGIDSKGKKMTLCQLYAKQNAQRANVKESTRQGRKKLMRILEDDILGARRDVYKRQIIASKETNLIKILVIKTQSIFICLLYTSRCV